MISSDLPSLVARSAAAASSLLASMLARIAFSSFVVCTIVLVSLSLLSLVLLTSAAGVEAIVAALQSTGSVTQVSLAVKK